jgi:hypothetical protein
MTISGTLTVNARDLATATGIGEYTMRVCLQRTPHPVNIALKVRRGQYGKLLVDDIADDAYARIRDYVKENIGEVLLGAAPRLDEAYQNASSKNLTDWHKGIRSCRSILQDVADEVFPPTDETRRVEHRDKVCTMVLGKEQPISRIAAYVGDKGTNDEYRNLVASLLLFLGDLLDMIFNAVQRSPHDRAARRKARRFVAYTHLLLSDVLSLLELSSGR